MTRTTKYAITALPTPQIVGPYSRWPREAKTTTSRPAVFAGLAGAAVPAQH